MAETSANGEAQKGKLELKDVVILVPTLGTAMAAVWEITRLMPFGGFSYFSLTDHLLAALQALPFAIVLSALLGAIYTTAASMFGTTGRLLIDWLESKYQVPNYVFYILFGSGVVSMVVFFGGILAAMVVVSWNVFVSVSKTHEWPAWGITGITVVVISFFAIFGERGTKPVFYAGAIFAVIALTAAVALDVSHYQVDRSWARRSMITLKSGPLQAVVLMTGDRGLLLYDPVTDHVTYHRFDDVEKIDWVRPSVWDWLN